MGSSLDDAYVYSGGGGGGGSGGGVSSRAKTYDPAPPVPPPVPPMPPHHTMPPVPPMPPTAPMLPMPEFKPFTHNAEDRFAQNQSLKATIQQNSLAAMLGAGVATAATAVGLRRASQYGGFDDVKTGVQEQKPITPTAPLQLTYRDPSSLMVNSPQEPLQLTYRPSPRDLWRTQPVSAPQGPTEPLQLTYRPEVSVPQELGAPPVPVRSKYYFWEAPQYTMSTTTPWSTTNKILSGNRRDMADFKAYDAHQRERAPSTRFRGYTPFPTAFGGALQSAVHRHNTNQLVRGDGLRDLNALL